MPGFLCPHKGYFKFKSLIVIGGFTWRMLWTGSTYEWESWNGSAWVSSGAPPTDPVGYVIFDPRESGIFYAKEGGESGSMPPSWFPQGTTPGPTPTVSDNEIQWELQYNQPFILYPEWQPNHVYKPGDTIRQMFPVGEPDPYGSHKYVVQSIAVTDTTTFCVREACRVWDKNANNGLGECGHAPNLGGTPPTPPPAFAALVSEYQGNEDLDGNGLVYGKDFMIDPTDPAKPPALASMEEDPDWTDPTSIMTWQEYLDSL